MYIDMAVLDQECVRLACLMADNGMEHLTLPSERTEEQEGAAIEDVFSVELAKSVTRIAEAGSDRECILPSMVMILAGKLSIFAIMEGLRTDRDAAAVLRAAEDQ